MMTGKIDEKKGKSKSKDDRKKKNKTEVHDCRDNRNMKAASRARSSVSLYPLQRPPDGQSIFRIKIRILSFFRGRGNCSNTRCRLPN
jgi:hypothetical protein